MACFVSIVENNEKCLFLLLFFLFYMKKIKKKQITKKRISFSLFFFIQIDLIFLTNFKLFGKKFIQ